MNDDDSAWADELIRRVRSSGGSRAGVERRVLAGVERRLGLAALDSSEAVMGGEVMPSSSARTPSGGVGVRAAARAPGGRLLLSLSRPEVWVSIGAFGLATGGLGYWWGSHSREPVTRMPVTPVEVAMPSGSIALGATPAASAPAASAPAASTPEAGGPEASRRPAPAEPLTSAASPPPASPTPERSAAKPTRKKRPPQRAAPRAAEPEALLSLGEAIALLQRAQTALRRGEPEEALELLATLEGRTPPGLVREELLVTRTLASCDLRDVEGARATMGELAGAESIYRVRLEASCVGSSIRDEP